jgi:hypothetical protein
MTVHRERTSGAVPPALALDCLTTSEIVGRFDTEVCGAS